MLTSQESLVTDRQLGIDPADADCLVSDMPRESGGNIEREQPMTAKQSCLSPVRVQIETCYAFDLLH